MKIALIGHGGMGQAVERVALERGHEIVGIIGAGESGAGKSGSAADGAGLAATGGDGWSSLAAADVVIDFSDREAVLENVRRCAEAGVYLVEGTTGWYEQMDEVKAAAQGIGVLWSSNFSIGVNLYFRIVEEAAKLMNDFDEYDIWGHEIHHSNKADSPSGTAKTLEKILLKSLDRKSAVVEDKLDRRREDNEIHFSSVRGGPVNFAHTIGFDSAADRILLTHEARSRDGYALGAVKAAEWLVASGRKEWLGMEDFLGWRA